MKALVIFKDSSGHPLDFFLKPKFKHCFVCIQSGDYWIEVNSIKNVLSIKVMTGADYDMAEFYSNQGNIVVLTSQRDTFPSKFNIFYGSFMIANCVGVVKSVLGINNLSWTPYSLYKELTK